MSILLVRFNEKGERDLDFGLNGFFTLDYNTNRFASGIVLDHEDRIIIVGTSVEDDARGGDSAFLLMRCVAVGFPDTSFSGDGKVVTHFKKTKGGVEAVGVALDNEKRIVVAGDGELGFALARYHSNGTLDTSFSHNGVRTDPFGSPASTLINARAYDLAVDSKGRIVVVGDAFDKGGKRTTFAVARYLDDGTLDLDFGHIRAHFRRDTDAGAMGVAIASGDRIVVAGSTKIDDDWRFGVMRFRADGSLDPSFARDGGAATNFFNSDIDYGAAVTLDHKGRIIVAGYDDQGFAVVRYLDDGKLDRSFSNDGKLVTAFAQGKNPAASDVAIDSKNRIVVAGLITSQSRREIAMARYLENGQRDETFSQEGKVIFGEFGWEFLDVHIALDSKDRVVLVSTVNSSSE